MDADDEEYIQPVDMLVPVIPCESRLSDMYFFAVASERPGSVCCVCVHIVRSFRGESPQYDDMRLF